MFLSTLLLAILTIGPGGFVNGKHCLGARSRTGQILPVFVMENDTLQTLVVTTIKTLQDKNGQVVAYVNEDPQSKWKLIEGEGGDGLHMSERDARVSGYTGSLNEPWLVALPAIAVPWTDLVINTCVSAVL